MEKIAEGKTKIVYRGKPKNIVMIKNKSILSKGDGKNLDPLEGKDIWATETTCNCFKLLNKYVPTHFIERNGKTSFWAWELKMIPIEVVARRIATGSYLKRNPHIEEGYIFDSIVVEFFLKDDARGDPLMVWRPGKKCFDLYEAKKPLSTESYIGELSKHTPFIPATIQKTMNLWNLQEKVFIVLERAWKEQNVALVDLKCEYGFTVNFDEIFLGDVVDNDSWRIWPKGDKKEMKDKEVYRQLSEITPDAKEALKSNYQWVAEATKKFLA